MYNVCMLYIYIYIYIYLFIYLYVECRYLHDGIQKKRVHHDSLARSLKYAVMKHVEVPEIPGCSPEEVITNITIIIVIISVCM